MWKAQWRRRRTLCERSTEESFSAARGLSKTRCEGSSPSTRQARKSPVPRRCAQFRTWMISSPPAASISASAGNHVRRETAGAWYLFRRRNGNNGEALHGHKSLKRSWRNPVCLTENFIPETSRVVSTIADPSGPMRSRPSGLENSVQFKSSWRNGRWESSVLPVRRPSTQVGNCNDLNLRRIMSVDKRKWKSTQKKTPCSVFVLRSQIRIIPYGIDGHLNCIKESHSQSVRIIFIPGASFFSLHVRFRMKFNQPHASSS